VVALALGGAFGASRMREAPSSGGRVDGRGRDRGSGLAERAESWNGGEPQVQIFKKNENFRQKNGWEMVGRGGGQVEIGI